MADRSAVDDAWQIHSTIVAWTANVDSKASFALAIESGVMAGVVSLAGDDRRLADLEGGWENALFWAGVALLAVALLTVSLVVRPRLRAGRLRAEAAQNYLFFGHLRHWAPEHLAAALEDRDVLPALSRQLIWMSEVAWLKHRLLQISMTTAMVAVPLLALAAVLNAD